MHTAEALAHVGDSVLNFGRCFEASTDKLIGATPAMRLAEKEEAWLTLPQQIQFSQHLETTTKANTYIMWGAKPSPQCKVYVATILGIPPPSNYNNPFF